MKSVRTTLALATLAILTATGGEAGAATIERGTLQNAGNGCTGALPTYEGALRKRPFAIQNEGTTPAFITCSIPIETNNASHAKQAYVRMVNTGGTDVSVSCTLVTGWQAGLQPYADYYPITVVARANTHTHIDWLPPGGATYFEKRGINFSCLLPPGISVTYVGKNWDEEIGL